MNPQPILAFLIWFIFGGLVYSWLYHPPSGDGTQLTLLNALVTMVGTAALAVTNYFFGSSSGSTAKDASIGRIAESKGGGTGDGNGHPPAPGTAKTVTQAAADVVATTVTTVTDPVVSAPATSDTPPANPKVGDRWRDTSVSPAVLRQWSGSAWIPVTV